MTIDHTTYRFRRSGLSGLLELMEEVAARRDGKAWLHIQPAIPGDRPPESRLARLFSARGPLVPNATWVPGWDRPKGPESASLGLEHPAGKNAAQQILDAGIEVPSGWQLQQDHPRRGLIVVLPDGYRLDEVLEFLLDSATLLSGVPISEEWVAVVSVQR